MTGDFQIGHFADFEQFTVDVHFANFGHVKTDPICSHLLLWTSHSYFSEFGYERWRKTIQTLSV